MLVGCDTCCWGFKVLGKPEDFRILEDPRWSGGFPCPTPGCPGLLQSEFDSVKRFAEISVPAFYRALHGMGFGKSTQAGPDRVLELLTSRKVIGADLSPIGDPPRSIIKCITFEDGTCMYLGSSNEGACVYLIEEGNDFYEDDSLAYDADSSGSTEDRTQARHSGEGEESSGGRVPGHSTDETAEHGPSIGSAGEVRAGPTGGPQPGGHGP